MNLGARPRIPRPAAADLGAGAHVNGHGPLRIDDERRPDRPIYLPSITRLLLTPAQQKARARLLAGRYFLVNMRLGEIGEIFRCSRCRGKHDRFTKYCLDRPFSGLGGALYAYVQTLAPMREIGALPPVVRARVDRLARLFNAHGVDLADSHPQLARHLGAAPGQHGQGDLDVGMVSLGLVERIEPKDAQRLLDRINTRAAAYRLPILAVPGLRSPAP